MIISVPISIASHLNSEPKSLQCGVELVQSIDEIRGLLDLLFFAKFTEKQQSELRGTLLNWPDMEEFVGLWIDSSVRSMTVIGEPNHRLIQRDLIRSIVDSHL